MTPVLTGASKSESCHTDFDLWQSLVEPLTPGVIPLDGKRPLPGSHGSKDASWDLSRFQTVLAGRTYDSVGLCLSDRLLVVDIDDLGVWSEVLGDHEPPETLTVRTTRGYHLYFTHSDAKPRLPVGVDVKASGGYVRTPGFGSYRLMQPGETVEIGRLEETGRGTVRFFNRVVARAAGHISGIPEWLAEASYRRPTTCGTGESGTGRNNTLISGAGRLRAMGLDHEHILAWCRNRNSRFLEPLEDREVQTVAASAASYPKGWTHA